MIRYIREIEVGKEREAAAVGREKAGDKS